MAYQSSKYPASVVAKALGLRQEGKLAGEIAKVLKVPERTVRGWLIADAAIGEVTGIVLPEDDLSVLKNAILKMTKDDPSVKLVDVLTSTNSKASDVEKAINELFEDGYDVHLADDGRVERQHITRHGSEVHLFDRVEFGSVLKFGLLGDNQGGNVAERLDVANAAYDHFAKEGIQNVYHSGNLLDGYRKNINFNELLSEAGFTIGSQCMYQAMNWPRREGITTHFITGECHEGWWYRDTGLNVGRVMHQYFQDAGRDDLRFVGHLECDIELRTPELDPSVRGPIMRLMHPGGGTAYALSYKAQKSAEALQGGEKPQIQAIGHYHKFDYNYAREIHNIMTGCLCDQTVFMRKHFIPAHVGYILCEATIGMDGILEALKVEWVPWFDRGFYAQWQHNP